MLVLINGALWDAFGRSVTLWDAICALLVMVALFGLLLGMQATLYLSLCSAGSMRFYCDLNN